MSKAFRALLGAIVILIVANMPRALASTIGCEPQANLAPIAEPYEGYSPTGFRGLLERDEDWWRAVRAVHQPDGRVLYAFRHATGRESTELYESINTVPLGGGVSGFAAYRQGCGLLVDKDGRDLGVPRFVLNFNYSAGLGDLQELGHHAVRLRLTYTPDPGSRHGYVLFVNGRLASRSPHEYLSLSYAVGTGDLFGGQQADWRETSDYQAVPQSMQIVNMQDSDENFGLLDLKTLREVFQPRWRGIASLTDFPPASGKAAAVHLLALDDEGLHAFTVDGRPLELPRFDRVKRYDQWFTWSAPKDKSKVNGLPWYKFGWKAPSVTLIALTDSIDGVCRIYDAQLHPLIDEALPLPGKDTECPVHDGDRNPNFVFTDAKGTVHVYVKIATTAGVKLEPITAKIGGKYIGRPGADYCLLNRRNRQRRRIV